MLRFRGEQRPGNNMAKDISLAKAATGAAALSGKTVTFDRQGAALGGNDVDGDPQGGMGGGKTT